MLVAHDLGAAGAVRFVASIPGTHTAAACPRARRGRAWWELPEAVKLRRPNAIEGGDRTVGADGPGRVGARAPR